MLEGKELGRAIREAIDLKLKTGSVRSVAEIASHFQVKPPSLYDWMNKGTIKKSRLPDLWNYFSDVVDMEHWGIKNNEITNRETAVNDNYKSYDRYQGLDDETLAVIDFLSRPPKGMQEIADSFVQTIGVLIRKKGVKSLSKVSEKLLENDDNDSNSKLGGNAS